MNNFVYQIKCDKCNNLTDIYLSEDWIKQIYLVTKKIKCKNCGHYIIMDDVKQKEVLKTKKMALNRTVKEVVEIEEKRHEGEILNVEERKSIYQGKEICYIDFTVSVDDMDNDVTLRVGYPDNLSNKSGLGIFLLKLGMDITPNSELDIENVKGKKISYMTVNQETDKGIFARIDKKSIMVVE